MTHAQPDPTIQAMLAYLDSAAEVAALMCRLAEQRPEEHAGQRPAGKTLRERPRSAQRGPYIQGRPVGEIDLALNGTEGVTLSVRAAHRKDPFRSI
jgi:hypothetical protein